MGKPKVFILFDQTVFVVGGLVSGRLEIDVDDPFPCSGVIGSLTATETVKIEKKQMQSRPWHEDTQTMWRPEGGELTLGKGIHAFPFAFQLPQSLPSSFEGSKVNMEYKVMCSVEVPGDDSEPFGAQRKVLVMENLCSSSRAEIGSSTSAQAKKRLLFGGKKEIALQIASNKSVFSAGEPVFLSLAIDNQSKKKVRGIKLAMRRVIEIRAADAKSRQFDIKSICKRSFQERDFRVHPFCRRHLVVDFTTPSDIWSIHQADLFSVSYVLAVSLETSFSKNLTVDIQLRIVHPASYNSIFFPSAINATAQCAAAAPDMPPVSPPLAMDVSYALEGAGTASSASSERSDTDAPDLASVEDAGAEDASPAVDEGIPVYTYQCYSGVDMNGNPVYYAVPTAPADASAPVPPPVSVPPAAAEAPSGGVVGKKTV